MTVANSSGVDLYIVGIKSPFFIKRCKLQRRKFTHNSELFELKEELFSNSSGANLHSIKLYFSRL